MPPGEIVVMRVFDRMGESMRRPYDWSEEVTKLSMPVMLVYGDVD
jgi:hypothetical protein